MEVFSTMTARIYLIAIIRFFKAMCCGIFEHLLANGSKDREFFGPISTYFGTVKKKWSKNAAFLLFSIALWYFLYNPTIQTIASGL